MANSSVCDCGVPWELPCKCPEKILERFSDYHFEKHGTQCFYYEDFYSWIVGEFGLGEASLVNDVLNLNGVEELGDSAYKTPYENDE